MCERGCRTNKSKFPQRGINLDTKGDDLMLTQKQKRYLKAQAHDLKPIIQIGKEGLSNNLLKTIDQALTAHELVKISILQNNNDEVQELILDISSRTRSDFVFHIGRQLIFYRSSKNKKIKLPQ